MKAFAYSLQFCEPEPIGVAKHFQADVDAKINWKFELVFNLADSSAKEFIWVEEKRKWNVKMNSKSLPRLTIFVGGPVDIFSLRFSIAFRDRNKIYSLKLCVECKKWSQKNL